MAVARKPTKEEMEVFGHNVQIDPETDKPIEQGLGSAKQPTASHLAALRLEEARRAASDGHKDSLAEVAKTIGVLAKAFSEKQKDF